MYFLALIWFSDFNRLWAPDTLTDGVPEEILLLVVKLILRDSWFLSLGGKSEKKRYGTVRNRKESEKKVDSSYYSCIYAGRMNGEQWTVNGKDERWTLNGKDLNGAALRL